MGCAVSAGEAGAWAKCLPPFRNTVLKLRQCLENINETNELSLRVLPGEAGLASPSAASSPRGGSLLALWSTPGLTLRAPEGQIAPSLALTLWAGSDFRLFGGVTS